ncbi:MAG: hypothetical protein CMN30_26890 [Sandaracinus sp.]|nr:hypothetical protein [Sandaracinus sp.]|tara:strand:+ start:817 stop:1404 length:588 start_codon:yes stop_codon:yes gene_type:complete
MSRRIRVLLTFALALAMGGLGFAVAQDGEGTETTSGAAEEAGLDATQRANLSPQEQMAEAQQVVERGNAISRQVSSMLDEARQERDIIRVTCLNDKLTQINANLRTAVNRADALEDAVEAQDTPRQNHEFTVVTVLAQKLQTLEREAQQCIGEDIFETGATSVTTEVPDDTVNPEDLPDTPVNSPVFPSPISPIS